MRFHLLYILMKRVKEMLSSEHLAIFTA